jgi:hypothetical protein
MKALSNNRASQFVASALAACAGLASTADAGIIGRAVVGNQLYYLNDNGALTSPKTISYQSYSGIGYIGLATLGGSYRAVSRAGAYANYYPQQVFSITDTGSTATAGLMNNTNWNMFTEGDCATDPTTGDLWAIKPNGQLYRFVNNAYNNGTLIGTIPGVLDASAMAFNPAGQLYVLDFSGNGRISRIDKTNASIISSAYSSVPLYSCDAGMYFNPANSGQLIISATGTSGNYNGQLLMKTTAATGAATVMGQTSPTQGIVVTSGTSGGPCFWWRNTLVCAVDAVSVNFNQYHSTQRVAAQSMWQIDTTAFGSAQDARIVPVEGDPVSPPRSSALIEAGTAIAQIGTFEHGQWTLSADLYVPSNPTPTPGGAAGLSLLTDIDLASGVRSEGAALHIDSTAGLIISSMGTAIPIPLDQWGTLSIDVDLGAGTQSAFYNGIPLYVGMLWSVGTPGAPSAIRGVSFWNQNGGAYMVGGVTLLPTDAQPTCVADVDDGSGTGTPDQGVTIDDLLYYLAMFEAGELGADVDDGSGTGALDGGVTIDDLLYYLQRFESGC